MAHFIDITGGDPLPDPGDGPAVDARYWLGAAHASLTNEHNLGALATGLVKNTAGTPSIATAADVPTPLTTKGDIFVFGSAATRLPVGTTNGHVLTVDSAEPTGLKWSAAAGGVSSVTAGNGLTGGGTGAVTVNVAATDATISVAADGIAVGTIQTANIAANAVANAKIRQSAALSVIGRSDNSLGDVADISTGGGSSAVLRESGGVLGFGTVATAGLANNAVTDAKLRQSAALSVIGNSQNITANVADLTAGTDGHVLRRAGTALGFGTLAAGAFAGTQTDGFVLSLASGIPTWQAASGGSVDGSGAATRLAYWSDADTLTSNAGLTYASQVLTNTAAATGADVTTRTENSTNTNTSSHAVVEARVGGTGGGDPQFSWNVPSGTSWVARVANNASDVWRLQRAGTTEVEVDADGMGINGSGGGFAMRVMPSTDNHTTVRFQTDGASVFSRHSVYSSQADVDMSQYVHGGSYAGTLASLNRAGSTFFYETGSDAFGVGVVFGTARTKDVFIATTAVQRAVYKSNGNYAFCPTISGGVDATTFGGGVGVQYWGNATTAPSTNPTAGVLPYVDPADGRLKVRDAFGVITVLT